MRILVVIDVFLSPSMTFVYNQLLAFHKEGHEVLVVANQIKNSHIFDYEGDVKIIEDKKNISYYVSKLKRGLNFDYTLYNSYYINKLEKEIDRFKPDIIHVQFGTQLIRIEPIIRSRSTPIVATFHGYDASRNLRNAHYTKRIQRLLALPHVFATTVASDMKVRLAAHSINTERTEVDYLGVDVDFFDPALFSTTKKGSQVTFLQVSNFVEKKGHLYTICAFARFLKEQPSDTYKLVLAGAGPLLDEMKALVDTLEIANAVHFVGLADKLKVRELMAHADVFVHHSVTAVDGDMEGLPTVLMEAMAMNLPVISTFHAGIPELVTKPEFGILVAERDEIALAEAFNAITNRMGQTASRSRIINDFNLQSNTQKILRIFEEIINE